jgi:hypothetical protein
MEGLDGNPSRKAAADGLQIHPVRYEMRKYIIAKEIKDLEEIEKLRFTLIQKLRNVKLFYNPPIIHAFCAAYRRCDLQNCKNILQFRHSLQAARKVSSVELSPYLTYGCNL